MGKVFYMTRPGIVPNLDLTPIPNAEQQIIRKLSSTWLITFAKRTQFKNAYYSFVFGKPSTHIANSFHLGREVLIVLSEDVSFEARTLDFVDKTIFEFQNRLDKLCIILISGDSAIRNKIKEMAIQDKESRIIIPFYYEEFLRIDY
ncbi:MAG: hypothetical protein HGA87_06535 [Desulfobulbaceae bacterium]|nr:hypothetical protein [Desulfobulbaceae bacterium]